MVAAQGPDPDDEKKPSTHAKRTPQKLQTPQSSSEEPKIKLESPAPASARRHDSPMPRSPLQHTRDEAATHGSRRPGVAPTLDLPKMQHMSLDELISLRRAERDADVKLAKTQRRIERLSQKMGWSPATTRAIEQLTSKKQAAAKRDGQGAASEAPARDGSGRIGAALAKSNQDQLDA